MKLEINWINNANLQSTRLPVLSATVWGWLDIVYRRRLILLYYLNT